MPKYEKVFEIDVKNVEIHELANLTPIMEEKQYEALKQSIKELGQLEPAIFWKGKLIDGRHRLKAIKELGGGSIKYKNLDPKMTYDEVKEIILKGYENRRHQTKAQKSIMAYRYFLEQKKEGIKITQGEVANMFGVHINDISLVKKLYNTAPIKVIDALFNGEKVKISDNKYTDNLRAVVNYFNIIADEMTKNKYKDFNLTDDEKEYAHMVVQNLYENHGKDFIEYLCMICKDYK